MNPILPLTDFTDDEIEGLLDLAFGPDRHGRTAYKMRYGQHWIPALSAGIRDDTGKVIGVIQSWPVSLVEPDGRRTALILVGPVAVDPDAQGAGIGQALMRHVLTVADQQQECSCTMMIGDPEYYGRFFGYQAAPTQQWVIGGPVERRRLLARMPDGVQLPVEGEIVPGWSLDDRGSMGCAA